MLNWNLKQTTGNKADYDVQFKYLYFPLFLLQLTESKDENAGNQKDG
jgi:hypothetical protein